MESSFQLIEKLISLFSSYFLSLEVFLEKLTQTDPLMEIN